MSHSRHLQYYASKWGGQHLLDPENAIAWRTRWSGVLEAYKGQVIPICKFSLHHQTIQQSLIQTLPLILNIFLAVPIYPRIFTQTIIKMQVPTILTLLTFAFAAVAMPSKNVERGQPTVGPGGNAACGNGQVISCCNTNSVSSGAGGLLGLGGALDGVLGGSCSPLNVALRKSSCFCSLIRNWRCIVAILVPVEKACGDNQAACCTGDQSVSSHYQFMVFVEYRINDPQGLVNVACTNVGVLWEARKAPYQYRL